MNYTISTQDRQRLRELAKKQLEFANEEKNLQRIQEWYRHNDLKGEKPTVQLELWTFAQEVIEPRLRCQSPFARELETMLYQNFSNQELFDDDRVTPDYFGINYDTEFRLFDIPIEIEHTTNADQNESVGHHFVSKVEDLEEDYEKLKKSYFSVDLESTQKKMDAAQEAFGDILPVKMQMDALYSVPTQMIVHFMSMENMLYNMMDYPELFLEMMNRVAEDTIEYFRMLEAKHLILPTTGFEAVGNGTWAFTNELPKSAEAVGRPLTTKDVWGFLDSQETVGISPKMFEELVFPCYQKIAEQYGLLSYGCCEPVDPIWDSCVSKLNNLRKVSISAWCNEEIMGEKLQGTKVIYHRKPSANFLGVGKELDEDAFRAHIRKSLLAARGCKMEITQRDVYTIDHNVQKARRYVEIIREKIEDHWKN